jgi:hypothetical protein
MLLSVERQKNRLLKMPVMQPYERFRSGKGLKGLMLCEAIERNPCGLLKRMETVGGFTLTDLSFEKLSKSMEGQTDG